MLFLSQWSWNDIRNDIFFINVHFLKLFGTNFHFFLNRCWLSWFNTAGCPFSFINQSDNNLNTLQNRILLIFKLYIYQSRERGFLKVHQCRYENLPTYSFWYENNMFKIIRSFTFWDMRAWHVWKVCLQTFRNNTIC